MLEMRVKEGDIKDLVKKLSQGISCKKFTVTLGRSGMVQYDEDQGYFDAPALALYVADRVGAGDTFLSLAGLCLGGGITSDIALFVGSAAAALDVQIVCNREPVTPVNLFKYLTTLLK